MEGQDVEFIVKFDDVATSPLLVALGESVHPRRERRIAIMDGRVLATVIGIVYGVQVGVAGAEDAGVAQGRKIAQSACSPCHAIGVTGASPKAEAPLFRELGRKYPVESLEEALAEGVVVGHPGMPQVKMREPEIGAFLAWLKSIQTP
jgi:mono/diheme cytochrome c family protein